MMAWTLFTTFYFSLSYQFEKCLAWSLHNMYDSLRYLSVLASGDSRARNSLATGTNFSAWKLLAAFVPEDPRFPSEWSIRNYCIWSCWLPIKCTAAKRISRDRAVVGMDLLTLKCCSHGQICTDTGFTCNIYSLSSSVYIVSNFHNLKTMSMTLLMHAHDAGLFWVFP